MSSQLPSGSAEHSPLSELSLLLERAQDIEDNPGDYSPEEIAGTALSLARVFSEVSSSIEPLKALLRQAASELLVLEGKTKGKVSIEGSSPEGDPLGEVSVTFPAAQLKLRKDFDAQALQGQVGEELFNECFETRVTYKPSRGFSDALLTLSATSEALAALLYSVERVEPTPRVGFPSAR